MLTYVSDFTWALSVKVELMAPTMSLFKQMGNLLDWGAKQAGYTEGWLG
jgi:hypothetical protein